MSAARHTIVMDQDTLYFIQPHVLDRLLTGKFVARRQQNKSLRSRGDERRNVFSPLNVTRRAIRYEYLVFTNRRETIIDTVNALNNPETKLVLVSGPSGRGKTSFIRGVVEMMGGGKEQLLWFDVSRHTDFDEVIRFLIDFMTYIFRNVEEIQDVPEYPNPIATLEMLLRQAADFPILIVIDNMEYLVAPDQTIRSRELKEAFNFLLSFPNVKLMLSGRNLPFADMNPSASAVYNVYLDPLNMAHSEAMVKELFKSEERKDDDLSKLLPFFQGEPYLLFLFGILYERYPDPKAWLADLSRYADAPEEVLLNTLYRRLSPVEKTILAVLSLIRHSATPSGLEAIVKHCEPEIEDQFDFKYLDQSYIRLLLKKVYPPQMVLNKLRNRHRMQQMGEEPDANDSIEAYYQLSELFQERIAQDIPEFDQNLYHERLQQFYLAEKNKHVLDRIYQARIRHLVAEAQYHYSKMRKRRSIQHTSAEPFLVDPNTPRPDTSVVEPLLGGLPPYMKPEAVGMRPPMGQPPTIQPDEPDTEEDPELLPDHNGEVSDHSLQQPAEPREISLQQQPITIQVESASPTVRLSDEDLKRLAELIAETRPGTRTVTRSVPAANMTAVSPLHPPEEMERAADSDSSQAMESDEVDEEPPVDLSDIELSEADPEEKAIQARLEEAMVLHRRDYVARELVNLGNYRMNRGFSRNAESCLLKAQEFARVEGMAPLELEILGLLGHLYQQHFQHNKALQYLRQAELLYEEGLKTEKDRDILARAYEDMAEIHVYRKVWNEAIAAYGKCLELKPDDARYQGEIRFKMALTYDEAGWVKEAIQNYKESFYLSAKAHNDYTCASSLYNLASLYFELDYLKEAKEVIQRCLIYDRRTGTDKELFRSLMLFSRIHEAQQFLHDARVAAEEALQVAKQANDKTNIASACMRLGDLAELAAAWHEARDYYRQAEAVARDVLSEESRQIIHQRLITLEERLA